MVRSVRSVSIGPVRKIDHTHIYVATCSKNHRGHSNHRLYIQSMLQLSCNYDYGLILDAGGQAGIQQQSDNFHP